jgi:ankyrin repeat protein
MTALMNAVNRSDAAAVNKLIAQGVNVSEADSKGDSPLIMAAYQGDTEIVRLLLEAGADVGALDPGMKATALHAASYAGHAAPARLLIQYGIDIDKQGPYNGYTALHDAIWQNHVEVAQVLIEAGADLGIRSNSGQTPLDFARSKGAKQIIAMIEQKLKG